MSSLFLPVIGFVVVAGALSVWAVWRVTRGTRGRVTPPRYLSDAGPPR